MRTAVRHAFHVWPARATTHPATTTPPDRRRMLAALLLPALAAAELSGVGCCAGSLVGARAPAPSSLPCAPLPCPPSPSPTHRAGADPHGGAWQDLYKGAWDFDIYNDGLFFAARSSDPARNMGS